MVLIFIGPHQFENPAEMPIYSDGFSKRCGQLRLGSKVNIQSKVSFSTNQRMINIALKTLFMTTKSNEAIFNK